MAAANASTSQQSGKVQHFYRDFSHVTEDSSAEARLEGGLSKGGVAAEQNFPVKLHGLLDNLEEDGLENVMGWQPHGRSFVVRDQKRFVEEILPLWWRQTKWASFQRQMNLYGFKRLTAGRDKGAYYHPLFLRSKRFLACRIERMKIKGEGARKASSPETEPDLYRYPFMPGRQSMTQMPVGPSCTSTAPASAHTALAAIPCTPTPLGPPSLQSSLLPPGSWPTQYNPLSLILPSLLMPSDRVLVAEMERLRRMQSAPQQHAPPVNDMAKLAAYLQALQESRLSVDN